MKIRIMERAGGEVREIRAAVVIVEDHLGNPVQLACEVIPGHIELEDVRQEAKFNLLLRALGLDKTVICEKRTVDPETGRLRI